MERAASQLDRILTIAGLESGPAGLDPLRDRSRIGPELVLTLARGPCYAMDLIAPGMKDAMECGEQGALERVSRAGEIWIGQPVLLRALVHEGLALPT